MSSSENDTGADVSGLLRVVVLTPDGRQVVRNVRTITVPQCRIPTGGPCPTLTGAQSETSEPGLRSSICESGSKQPTPSDIPSQPIGHEGLFHVEVLLCQQHPGFQTGTSNAF